MTWKWACAKPSASANSATYVFSQPVTAQRPRDRPQERAEFLSFRGGQLVQGGHMPAGQEHQPSWQRRPERVRDSPPRPEINELSRGQVRAHVVAAAKHASSSAITAV